MLKTFLKNLQNCRGYHKFKYIVKKKALGEKSAIILVREW